MTKSGADASASGQRQWASEARGGSVKLVDWAQRWDLT